MHGFSFEFTGTTARGRNGEFAIYNPIDLSTARHWSTQRAVSPAVVGYFSWTIASGGYTESDDQHHIDGYAKKYGPEAFTFPVGSGTDLRTLSMTAPSDPTAVCAVSWIVGDPGIIGDPTDANQLHPITSFSGNISAVSAAGQWDWDVIRGTATGVDITVSIPEITDPGFTDASLLRLVGWNGTAWVSLGAVGADALTENSTLIGTMIEGIQAIGIGRIAGTTLDSDKDSIPDIEEGPTADTDNDGIPNYLDPDDDGDGIPTISEHPDPNGDGKTDDAFDSDNNGTPDYLQPNRSNLKDELEIYNGISPDNGNYEDGIFIIGNIQLFPDNEVAIYDRWGVLIYKTDGYMQHDNYFMGNAGETSKYASGYKLKEDTYFYVITYRKDAGEGYKKRTGYLYIKR